MRGLETVKIEVEVKRICDLSILVDDGDGAQFIPTQLITEYVGESDVGNMIEIEIPEWFAREREFI